ncbi:lipase maturation factor family protein [Rhodococcus sp. NPDC058521]|uniref:lipase maturation factor family protein n=1 Tax=Rhodococcus sp. NPDC058521 TaxID=3346536 RepID=UPI00366018FD
MGWFAAENYSLGRLLFTEGLAALYLVAFVAAARQFRSLIGTNGILPVPDFVRDVSFAGSPSIFHLHYSDRFFAVVAWCGAGLSGLTLAGVTMRLPLAACMLVWFVLWCLYLSIVNVGQAWYAFGWESLLLEVGFLAVFLGNADTAPPVLVLVLLRWVLFRLEFGAGLIKMRGDRCWRDLTCLCYHHETQPIPGPFSRAFHHLPAPVHKVEAAGNHVTQLVVPFALFLPQPVAGIAAGIMILTQLWLVASGNFAWLNWVTIVLAVSVLPDSVLEPVLPLAAGVGFAVAPLPFVVAVVAVTVLVVLLSYRPVRNLISASQVMNASFDKWHLVNTYGAFGTVTRIRHEIVLEGTADSELSPSTGWWEYEFRGKPGNVYRRPRQFAPYHLRLDWLMWFAALSPSYARSWFPGLVDRLLAADPQVLVLLREDPFSGRAPRFVRARYYRYRFTTREEHRATGAWWHRELVGDYMPPASLD